MLFLHECRDIREYACTIAPAQQCKLGANLAYKRGLQEQLQE
jgi:hypothetical protein